MKANRSFIIIIAVLSVLYIVVQINRPKDIDWTVTLSSADKNPYGGFIIYQQLNHLFQNASIYSNRRSIYSQINASEETNTAYFIVGEAFRPATETTTELKNYVGRGNYVFMAANWFYTPFLDSLGVEADSEIPEFVTKKDSTNINFVNPALRTKKGFTHVKGTIDQHFSKIDTARAIVLSTNNTGKPVYIKLPYGKGAFFIHTAPLCFSNYFLLQGDNASYASKALSYLPSKISMVYWDENEKVGLDEPRTPFRFFLSNEFLRWALRLSLLAMVLYVLFEMKRRQRIIPVITPLANSTLDFVKIVAAVYYNEKDNKGIAQQKISYFFEFVRTHFNISTTELDDEFIRQFQRKSGIDQAEIVDLTNTIKMVLCNKRVNDTVLLNLNSKINNFYKKAR